MMHQENWERRRSAVLSPRRARRVGTDLARYHERRIAVILSSHGITKPFCGTAKYELDETLGYVLRISDQHPRAEELGGAALIIAEKGWEGEIIGGDQYDCDYCFVPSPNELPG